MSQPDKQVMAHGEENHHGQIILFEQFMLLRKTWWWVLIIAIIATAGTAYYVFNYIPVKYKATIIAVPPNKSGTPLDNLTGGIASTLKDFGLAKLTGKSSSENGYSKTVLLTCRTLLDSLITKHHLKTVYASVPANRPDQLYDELLENIEVDINPEGPIGITVYDTDPKRAAAMATDVIAFTNFLARDLNRRETDPIARFVGDRYEQARSEQVRLGKELRDFMGKNKIYSDEQAMAAGSELVNVKANAAAYQTQYEIYLKTLGAEDPRTVQAKQMLDGYDRQARKLAMGQGGPINTIGINKLPTAAVEYLRIKQDYEVNAKVLALLEPMYEQTKYDAEKDIPVLNVLDNAFAPPIKAKPKRGIIIASAFIGTILISYIIIALITYLQTFLSRYRSYLTQIQSKSTVQQQQPRTLTEVDEQK